MKVTVDTNILVRAVVRDDERQASAAAKLLMEAELIAVPLTCLCEFAWVLSRAYHFSSSEIATALAVLLQTRNIAVDRPSVEAGIMMLECGGDFADGVIAHEGRWLGGDTFVSFDRKAVALMKEQGHASLLLTSTLS